MKSLYSETNQHTEESIALCNAVESALTPIMRDYASKGYNPREIFGEMCASAHSVLLLEVIPYTKKK